MTALAGLLRRLATEPSRTGSVILTVYGDAILPRGGEAAMADLLVLGRALGVADGVVRTAVSRLARDGWLERHRQGRHSFYRLPPARAAEFRAAAPRIYARPDPAWDGSVRLAWPDPGPQREALEGAGWAVAAPGVLLSPGSAVEPGDGMLHLRAIGDAPALQALAARAWPLARLDASYARFRDTFGPVQADALPPLDAMAVRVLLLHEHRRVALRDPRLPSPMLPDGWHGTEAWDLCGRLYAALAPASERWLDQVQTRTGPLPSGPDPAQRFGPGLAT